MSTRSTKGLQRSGGIAVEALYIDGTEVTASAAELNLLASAGVAVPSGTQAGNIAEIAITYSLNDPSITPDGAVTVADGATPTVSELLELCEELKANQDAIIAALEAFGIAASS